MGRNVRVGFDLAIGKQGTVFDLAERRATVIENLDLIDISEILIHWGAEAGPEYGPIGPVKPHDDTHCQQTSSLLAHGDGRSPSRTGRSGCSPTIDQLTDHPLRFGARLARHARDWVTLSN